jgi:hypothetical protein
MQFDEQVDMDAMIERVAVKVVEQVARTLQFPSKDSISPRLLSVKQGAAYIGRTEDSVQHLIATGRLPVVRTDRRVFLDIRDLDSWIEDNKRRG